MMKKLAKCLFDAAFSVLLPVVSRLKTRKLIVAYHDLYEGKTIGSCENETYCAQDIRLEVAAFEAQLRWLATIADFVTLEQLCFGPDAPDPGRWQVSITFDDAYRNVLRLGLPCMERLQAPSAVFVPVDYVENRNRLPWWDLIAIICDTWEGLFEVPRDGGTVVSDLAEASELRRFQGDMSALFFASNPDEALRLQTLLEAKYNEALPLPENDVMDKHELQDINRSRFIVLGSHTASHLNTGRATRDEFKAELQTSSVKLDQWTGSPGHWFAYPYGKRALRSDRYQDLLQGNGYRGALTTDPGYVYPDSDVFALPRLSVDAGWSLARFQSRVLASDFYAFVQDRTRK